jgi:threonine synthase
MWKAFEELQQLGWLDRPNLPRMVVVQSSGCAPIVRAFEAGERFAQPFEGAATVASGIRVPAAVGDFMILDAVRASQGTAIAVPENTILESMRRGVRAEGISFCPESAACISAAHLLRQSGWIHPAERVVIYNCGAAQKYPHVAAPQLPTLDPHQPIDWNALVQA